MNIPHLPPNRFPLRMNTFLCLIGLAAMGLLSGCLSSHHEISGQAWGQTATQQQQNFDQTPAFGGSYP